MLKLILCIIIVASCGGLGILKSLSFSDRLNDLADLKHMIRILQTEMNYKKDPLPNAFSRISKYKNTAAMHLLAACSENMKNNLDFRQCWENAITSTYNGTSLKDDDLRILKDMGLQLGKSDLQGQAAMFSLTNIKLDDQIAEAAEERKTKGKMYKSLGFSIGAVIAILLI